MDQTVDSQMSGYKRQAGLDRASPTRAPGSYRVATCYCSVAGPRYDFNAEHIYEINLLLLYYVNIDLHELKSHHVG